MISIIHVHDADFSDPRTIYIGRAIRNQRYHLTASPLANPYKLSKDNQAERSRCCFNYFHWLMEQLSVGDENPVRMEMMRLIALIQSGPIRFACWCGDKLCHGDVIASILLTLTQFDGKLGFLFP